MCSSSSWRPAFCPSKAWSGSTAFSMTRPPQQGFNELEQARDAAAIRLDDVPSDGSDSLTLRRIGQEPHQRGRQLPRIVYLQRCALLEEQPRNVLAIGMMRPRQHRKPQRRGFQQIVAADRHQASADELAALYASADA